jgi:hypothetical protein
MAVDPSVVINLAAEYTGNKAFKQADTAVGKLNSNVKKLAGTFGIAFGATALVQFSKTAVKAFAADEAAALRLNRAVENLGIGFANPAIADYIDKLETSAAIADDILRPAFQGLLTTTGSLTQSQKLLNDAITISRASGIDLATVTQDLGKGYVGVTRGLVKYNSGLTKAELTTLSFNEILSVILKRSAGAAEDYLTTTSYKMDVLSTATGKANELIGKGFVDALSRASGGTEASDATIFLETLAGGFNKVTLAAGTAIGAIPSLIKNVKDLGKSIFFGFAGKQIGVTLSTPSKKPIQSGSNLNKSTATTENKIAKENLKINTAQLKLAKAKSIFDIQKIQIEAALKGKISEEDRIRLKLMQAIESENISQIEKYTKLLDDAQKNTEKLVSTLAGIKPLDDIFKNFNFMSVKEQLASLESYFKNFAGSAASAFNSLAASQRAALGGFVPFAGASNASLGITSNGGATTSMPSTVGLGKTGTGNQLPAGVTINTNVNTGIGDPETIARAVEDVIRQAVQRGTSSLLLPV